MRNVKPTPAHFSPSVPGDFTGLTDFRVEFPAVLSVPGSTQVFLVVITNDAIPELTESFSLRVGTNDPDALVATEFATGIINDDDGELVNILYPVLKSYSSLSSLSLTLSTFPYRSRCWPTAATVQCQ